MGPVKTVRNRATDRSDFRNFSGFVIYHAEVASGSFLHVGSGEREKQLKNYEELRSIVSSNKPIDINKVTSSYLASSEIAFFAHYGDRNTEQKQLIIPGSTVKGLSRFRMEHSFKIINGLSLSCFIIQSKYAPPRNKIMNFLNIYGDGNSITPRFTCRGKDDPCVTCNIYGKMGLRSRVHFTDALLQTSEHIARMKTEFGSYLEVIKEGGSFSGKIYFDSLLLEEIGLILNSLGIFTKAPVPVGLSKYRSFKLNGKNVTMGKLHFNLKKLLVRKPNKTYKTGKKVKPPDNLDSFLIDSQNAMNQKYGKYLREINEYGQ